MVNTRYRRGWKLIGALGLLLVFLIAMLPLIAEKFVEPILRNRINTLIVQGSDSLYTYKMGSLDASFLGGSVEIGNLEISVDSTQYQKLRNRNALPSLTMQLKMGHGHIHGIGIFSLLFGKNLSLGEVFSKDANLVLLRHTTEAKTGQLPPLWKSIQPVMKSITISKIQLDGLKLLYKHDDTSHSVKLQFDTCNALFEKIRIDSASSADPERIGFAKKVELHFYDLKFRSYDSTYKLKAGEIDYSSSSRSLIIRSFKLQPTLKDKKSFYEAARAQKTMSVIEFEKLSFTNFQLEQFLHNNSVKADSVLIEDPSIDLYVDKTLPPLLEGKMGTYPHQKLLNLGADVQINGLAAKNLSLTYTEKGEKSGNEGQLKMRNVSVKVNNITNMQEFIKANPRTTASTRALSSTRAQSI